MCKSYSHNILQHRNKHKTSVLKSSQYYINNNNYCAICLYDYSSVGWGVSRSTSDEDKLNAGYYPFEVGQMWINYSKQWVTDPIWPTRRPTLWGRIWVAHIWPWHLLTFSQSISQTNHSVLHSRGAWWQASSSRRRDIINVCKFLDSRHHVLRAFHSIL